MQSVNSQLDELKQDNKALKAHINELKEDNKKLESTLCEIREDNQRLMQRVKDLELKDKKNCDLIKVMNSQVHKLETTVDDLEQYTRREDLVISGISTRFQSYAKIAQSSQNDAKYAEATQEEQDSLESQVLNKLAQHGIVINPEEISVCHTLGKGGRDSKPPVIIRLVSRKTKSFILSQAKKLKGTNIYINEHLTRKNAAIAKEARRLRKENKIISTWSRNCKIFVKYNDDREHTKVSVVTELAELHRFN